jgi:hypothetical protein
MKAKVFAIGDRVRLTGAFLRNTGQQVGGEGRNVWTVIKHPGCNLCADHRFVLTNEPRQDDGMFTAEELAADPFLKYRHINAANLEKAR